MNDYNCCEPDTKIMTKEEREKFVREWLKKNKEGIKETLDEYRIDRCRQP
jgi:hypothetical protein